MRRATLRVAVSTAEAPPDAPAVGPVDTLRVDLRGPGGELLEHSPVLPLRSDVTRFEVPLFGRVGRDRQVTVLFSGARDVRRADGAGVEPARGLLYTDRVTGVDLKPGVIAHVTARVHLFVPRTRGVDRLPDGRYRLRWEAIRGADRYRVTRIRANGARSDTLVADTTLVQSPVTVTCRVSAIEASTSLAGAPGDEVVLGSFGVDGPPPSD